MSLEDLVYRDDWTDDAKTLVVLYNASSYVYYGGMALGAFFTAIAIGLTVYYILQTGGARAFAGGRSRGYSRFDEEERPQHSAPWTVVLEGLEAAYLLWGIKEETCKERLACEVYRKDATEVNQEAAVHLSKAIGKLSPALTQRMKGAPRKLAQRLLEAAHEGRHSGDCADYAMHCPHQSLQRTIVTSKQSAEKKQ